MGGSHRTCAICGVKEIHEQKKLFFARFPLEKDRCKEWVKAVGNQDLIYLTLEKLHSLYHVCEIHFKKRDFTKTGARLKKRAVPKLHLSAEPIPEELLKDFPLEVARNSNELLGDNVRPSTRVELEHAYSLPSTSQQALQNETNTMQHIPLQTTGSQKHPRSKLLQENVNTSTVEQEQYTLPSTSQQAQQMLPKQADAREHLPLERTGSQNYLRSCKLLQENVKPSTVEQEQYTLPSPSQQAQQMLPKRTDAREDLPLEPTGSQKYLRSCRPLSEKNANSVPTETIKHGNIEKKRKRKLEDVSCMTPRKQKLMAQLLKTKYSLSSLRRSAKLIENLPSPFLKELVLCSLKNKKRRPQGRRWTTKTKVSCLSIFKRSPKTYRYMQHIIPMPSTKTLQNILKRMPMEPGISKLVLQKLEKLTTTGKGLRAQDKLCILAFDEIALKPRILYNGATDKVEGYTDFGGDDGRTSDLADHALVFLLQGVHKKFKQPLAFYFLKGTVSSQRLAVLIKEIINAVNKCGFTTIATVCDQGPTNMGAIKFLKSWHNGGDNYFVHDNKKIFFIYDVPHLFKSIRNNFLKQGILEMDGKRGQWSHLTELEEKNRSFLYISKITPTHVQPKYRAKMKVKYAAELLSQTVAAVLKLMSRDIENYDRRKEIYQTAELVEEMNKLFDFTNGPSGKKDIKIGIRQNASEKTEHVQKWKEFIKKISTLKFIGKNGLEARNVKCVEGYVMTLQSLCDIWSLTKEQNFKYLNLRQLNQDALENFFGLVRQQNPTDKHPTCSAFMAATKSLILSGMTAPHSRHSNCEKDEKELLTDFQDLIFKSESTNIEPEIQEDEDMLNINEMETGLSLEEQIPVLSLPEKNLDYVEIESDLSRFTEQPLVYVSGYIASVLKKQKNCLTCWNCLCVSDPGDNKIYELIKLREWWTDKQSLTYPSVNLCRTVETSVKFFEKEIVHNLYKPNICLLTVTLFQVHCDVTWFNCHSHAQDMINNLFIRLAVLFIRRQCQRINLNLSLKEDNIADANKKGQQYGAAK